MSKGAALRIEEGNAYSLDFFCVPSHYEPYLDKVLIPSGLIADRVERLARDIVHDMQLYQQTGESSDGLVCLCVLKGGYKFFSDLIDCIKALTRTSGHSLPFFVDFIRMKSYQNDKSTGEVTLSFVDSLEFLKNKNVLIVEDIVDTGRTIERLTRELANFSPKRIIVASLLVKREIATFHPDYVAFDIPNLFVVGYALDYNEHFRDLNHLCIINEAGKEHFKKS